MPIRSAFCARFIGLGTVRSEDHPRGNLDRKGTLCLIEGVAQPAQRTPQGHTSCFLASGQLDFHYPPGKRPKAGEREGRQADQDRLMAELQRSGWKIEELLAITLLKRLGKLDAVLYSGRGPVAFEWEPGTSRPATAPSTKWRSVC